MKAIRTAENLAVLGLSADTGQQSPWIIPPFPLLKSAFPAAHRLKVRVPVLQRGRKHCVLQAAAYMTAAR